jgi:hypothetical protein
MNETETIEDVRTGIEYRCLRESILKLAEIMRENAALPTQSTDLIELNAYCIIARSDIQAHLKQQGYRSAQ